MARPHPLPGQKHPPRVSLRNHLVFTFASVAVILALNTLLRAALLVYNRDLVAGIPASSLAESFLNGLRFDLRLAVYVCLPLLASSLSLRAMAARRFHVGWLTACCSLVAFLGLVELNFYREFHQRLNSLVFQYLAEDSQTVLSMLWHGYPVLRYLLLWCCSGWILWRLFRYLDTRTRALPPAAPVTGSRPAAGWHLRLAVFLTCSIGATVAARGTLEHGPPLRWGAAFTTDFLFANQLGLNGTLTLAEAARERWFGGGHKIRRASIPDGEALAIVRDMLLTPQDRLLDRDSAAVRRVLSADEDTRLPLRNVVVILMESFAGHYVGALGGAGEITPNFDALSKEGVLFTRFFANGTHTHQGMFATMACFPNLPGFEYLMQQPEGTHRFSGLPQLLSSEGYDDVYVYNGAFSWDNQYGFFGAQGMRNFIGRDDFVDPVFTDPTWGVSDQDMFDRAALELHSNFGQRPFYALLQTLSNHTPYALPEQLPVAPVTGFAHLNEHLTAMRYADWALGRFFASARQLPYYRETLFVIVGDHGFGNPDQLTDMDLYRYHVPLLMIAPGMQEKFGERIDSVGTQVDIVPTIMGRLAGPVQHQCWGRDLLNLPPGDRGFGVIKPSGSNQTLALIEGDAILVEPPDRNPVLYRYALNQGIPAERQDDPEKIAAMTRQLEAFVQVSTQSLLTNTAGAVKQAH